MARNALPADGGRQAHERRPTEAAYPGLASPDHLRQAYHAPLERLGAWPADQFEGAEASRIVPAIHPLAANLTVGVVCVKGCCGESLSIDGPAPALVVPDKLSPTSAHGLLSQSGLCSMLSPNSDRHDGGLIRFAGRTRREDRNPAPQVRSRSTSMAC
jgi:hypothetical protein